MRALTVTAISPGLFFLLVYVMVITSVGSTSVPVCGRCNPRFCQFNYCRCGYYVDYCRCCRICYKCPGERCSFVAMERCMTGTRCISPRGENNIVAYNMGGYCLG